MSETADLLDAQVRAAWVLTQGRAPSAKELTDFNRLLAEQVEHFADLLLCDRPIDRVRGALKLVFTPTAGDYEAMRLPPALWSAYYASRPCRLAFRTATRRA